MLSNYCSCGHLWSDHYDGVYCLDDNCACGPCDLCWEQFVEHPMNTGICFKCKELKKLLDELLQEM